MFDFNILLDFYFFKYLFLASVFYGICRLVNLLIFRR